jgi:protoheme IX farnesyltransferase
MPSEEACSAAEAPAARGAWSPVCVELAKGRLTALVLATALIAYLLAGNGVVHWGPLLWLLLGTALTAGGANALNEWLEIQRDARMQRTCGRPLPTGRVSPARAFRWAAGGTLVGCIVLAAQVNGLTAALGLTAVLIYVLLYTPLKPRSSLCTLVGAVCGAIPPMMGWTAATGRLDYGAWVLGTVLFVWQIPHFLSLGWLHREDYARGGFRVLPATDHSGQMTCQTIVLYSMALPPLALAATVGGVAGTIYAAGSLVLGVGLVGLAVQFYRRRTSAAAYRLFIATIIYLPLLLGLMLADRRAPGGGGNSPGIALPSVNASPAPWDRVIGIAMQPRSGGAEPVQAKEIIRAFRSA